jgi:SAM-dependent methyltransferase
MDPMVTGWLVCPRCGGELSSTEGKPGVRCQGCGHEFGARGGLLDLVDAEQRVSSEGPGDTLAMAWRRRRWDELRGSDAPENVAYLSAIWERLRPDDRVVDLGCGPGSFLGWMAEFAPDLAILGLDLSWPALEEAVKVARRHANVRLVRASTRRRLPLGDGSTDVVLRRLAPGLPEEAVRVLAPGGYYLRFTFGPGHWREVYDRVPGLPRAREDAIAGESARLVDLGLEVMEPTQVEGSEEVTSAAVMLALRSNPAAFHMERVQIEPLRKLWFEGGERRLRARLSTEYLVLVARKPGAVRVAVPAKPKRARKTEAQAEAIAVEPPAVDEAPTAEPPAEEPTAKPKRARNAAAKPAEAVVAEAAPAAKPKRVRKAAAPVVEVAAEEPAAVKPKRVRKKPASEPASAPPPAETPPLAPDTTARPRRSGRSRGGAEPSG